LRVRIVFNLKNRGAYVPFHHQYLLAQVIKGVLLHGNAEKYRNYIDYNFSGLKGQTKISRKGLHFYSAKVTLVFSCNEKSFLDHFITNLFSLKEFNIGNLQLAPESVEAEEHEAIDETVKFLCLSPIVLIPPNFNDDKAKKFMMPDSDEFSDMLYESTIARMEKTGRYTPEQLTSFYKFQLVPDMDYINRLQQSNKKFARIYPLFDQDIRYEVRGYTFPFTLYASKTVQQFLFECGLGYFSHKGFGMLDIAQSEPIKRAQIYQELNFA
jgi:CRISPR-associated endoribonuclease Cas6